MSHMKRHEVPKNWPVPRKGTTFVVTPNFGREKGLPILIVLRDVLKIAKNRKEVKRALHEKKILLNGKEVKDEKNSAQLYDVITLVPSKKNYKISLSGNGKFTVEETAEKDSDTKIAKVTGKKTLKKKKVQINLSDGRNFLSEIKCEVNDSVVVDFKGKKIGKILPLKEKANIIVIAGKHAGEKGQIEKIDTERKMVKISNGKERANVLIKQIMVTE